MQIIRHRRISESHWRHVPDGVLADAQSTNPSGAIIVTLADWLCACGMGPNLPEGASFTTLEIKTNFLGTVREGGAAFGKAWPVHQGRTTQVWDVEVSNEATKKVIALFRCTQMVLLPR